MPNQSPKIPLLLLSEAARICPFSIRMSEGWPATLPAYDLAQLMAGATPRERKDAFETWAAVIQYSIDNKSLATIKIRKARPQVAVIGRIGPASGEFRPPPEPVYYDLLHVTREATAAWLAHIRETPSELVAAWLLSGGIALPTAGDSEQAPRIRISKLRAILLHFMDSGVLPAIECIWLHIQLNAGKDGFPFKTRSVDTAFYADDGEPVSKAAIERALAGLPEYPPKQ